MINSNFKLQFKLDCEELFRILKAHHKPKTKDTAIGHVDCTYNPSRHACVNIKFPYSEDQEISIFVFHTGSIIITGGKNLQHIISAYKFIINIIDVYKDSVKITELDPIEVNKLLKKFIKKKEKQTGSSNEKTVIFY